MFKTTAMTQVLGPQKTNKVSGGHHVSDGNWTTVSIFDSTCGISKACRSNHCLQRKRSYKRVSPTYTTYHLGDFYSKLVVTNLIEPNSFGKELKSYIN